MCFRVQLVQDLTARLKPPPAGPKAGTTKEEEVKEPAAGDKNPHRNRRRKKGGAANEGDLPPPMASLQSLGRSFSLRVNEIPAVYCQECKSFKPVEQLYQADMAMSATVDEKVNAISVPRCRNCHIKYLKANLPNMTLTKVLEQYSFQV